MSSGDGHSQPLLLEHLTVVEVAGDPPGEMVGKILALMGADVIKVEPPAGSPTRTVGPFADDRVDADHCLTFWYYNTNKRSVVIDHTTDDSKAELFPLLATADICITTLRPPEARELGLEAERLRTVSDRLTQPEYLDPAVRQQNFGHIQDVVEASFLVQTAEEAYHEGQARGLAIGPVNAPDELFDDEHLQAREFFVTVEHDDVAPAQYPGVPYRFSAFGSAEVCRAPKLGEHTDEVLDERLSLEEAGL